MENNLTFQEFCEQRKLTPEVLADKSFTLEIDADKSCLPVDEITLAGHLSISAMEPCALPPVIRIGGDLFVEGTGIADLPKVVEVGGKLIILNTSIREIHTGCKVQHISAIGPSLERLPENWVVPGDMKFEDCPFLEFPAGLDVGKLSFVGCLLSELPPRLHVRQCLNISNSFITEIPADCEVGSLIASNCALSKLPDNWKVKGDVHINGSALRVLPKGLCVEYLDICESRIKEIPADANIRCLKACYSALERIPDHWAIAGDLILAHCKHIQSLPNGLSVGGLLDIGGTNIQRIPADCKFFSLHAVHSALQEIGAISGVPGRMDISYTKVKTLPDLLVVGGDFVLNHTLITHLPHNLVVGGCLSLVDSLVEDLPDDGVVGGCTNLKGSRVRIVPAFFVSAELLFDKGVDVQAYRFSRPNFEFHPSWKYCRYKKELLQVEARTEEGIHCKELFSDEEIIIKRDKLGRFTSKRQKSA